MKCFCFNKCLFCISLYESIYSYFHSKYAQHVNGACGLWMDVIVCLRVAYVYAPTVLDLTVNLLVCVLRESQPSLNYASICDTRLF